MKKFLALVLALVMTMSLVTISAGAEDFTDDASITYEEAVDVMTAIGVVGGYADGSFNPTAGLTRGAAAKIICNMLLGPTTAEALVANDAPFSDVAADNVFAGYIAYCVNEGIISGYADGTFKPAAPLTGYAFMKMLLGALGYDATVEGYVGSNWSIAVAKRALNIGLDDGLVGDFSGAKALTREEAALYAFNALKANMVKYDNKSTIQVGDITIKADVDAETIGVDELSGSAVNYAGDTATAAGIDKVQFCEEYFPGLKLANTVDGFFSAGNTWTNKGVKVGTYAGSSTLVYTSNLNTVAGKEALKADLKDYNNYNGAAVPLYINGSQNGTISVTEANLAPYTGNGVTVEVYASNNGFTKVVVKIPVVAEVTAVNTKTEKVSYTTLASATSTYAATAVSFTAQTKGYGDVEKGDLVLLYVYDTDNTNNVTALATGLNTIASVEELEEVEGLAKVKNTANNTITIDGVAYKSVDADIIPDANDVATFAVSSEYAATLYLDQFGYVVYAESGAAATDVKSIMVTKQYSALNADGAVVPFVKGILASGEEVAWEKGDGSSATITNGKVYTYAYDTTDKNYDLTDATSNIEAVTTTASELDDGQTIYLASNPAIATTSKTLAIKDDDNNDQKLYYADDVKFIFWNGTKATVLDGVQKVAQNENIYYTIDVDDDGVAYIPAVYVIGTPTATTKSSEDLILVLAGTKTDDGYSLIDADNNVKLYDTYTAYQKGEKLDLFYADAAADLGANGFYVDAKNTNGDWDVAAPYNTTTGKLAVYTAAEDVVDVVDNTLSTTNKDLDVSTAVIVDTTDNNIDSAATLKVELDAVKAANASKDIEVMVIYNEETMVAEYVYVTAYNV